MKFLLYAPLLLLASCGPLAGSFLTEQERASLTPAARVFQLQGEFNILLSQFGRYAAQPFCMVDRPVACAERKVVVQADVLTRRAEEVLAGAKAAVRTGAGDVETAAAGARVAVAQLSRYLIIEGIAQ